MTHDHIYPYKPLPQDRFKMFTAADPVVLAASGAKLNVIAAKVRDTRLRKHRIVVDHALAQCWAVVSDGHEL